jgi:hypothetical protein
VTGLGSHWALFRGPRTGSGTRTDIELELSGTGNNYTNIMSHGGQPQVANRPNYNIQLSDSRPTPYYVANSVSSQALSAACRSVIEGFQYNAVTNNCQTFVLAVLRTLVQRGHITQREYDDVYSQIGSWLAPAHH